MKPPPQLGTVAAAGRPFGIELDKLGLKDVLPGSGNTLPPLTQISRTSLWLRRIRRTISFIGARLGPGTDYVVGFPSPPQPSCCRHLAWSSRAVSMLPSATRL